MKKLLHLFKNLKILSNNKNIKYQKHLDKK